MDRRAWQAAVHGVAKTRTQVSNTHTHTHTQTLVPYSTDVFSPLPLASIVTAYSAPFCSGVFRRGERVSFFLVPKSESEVTQSCLTLCDPWTVVGQAPPSMGFSRQEYCSGVPFPSPGDLPDPGIESWPPSL